MRERAILMGVLGLCFAAASIISCGNATSPTPPPQPKADPSFAADIQPIFTASCVSPSCHGGAGQAGLVLTAGQAYAELVNIASTQEPARSRVLPGDSMNSYIVIKLEGRQTVGTRMPPGAALNAVSVQNIKNWIDRGANNN